MCEDGELRLIGGNSGGEGRLEVCFDKRWGTIDGDGWTHTDTEVACRQLGYSTSGKAVVSIFLRPVFIMRNLALYTDVSYTESLRPRYSVSQSLPAFMSKVGCYGSEKRLVDCDHQKLQYHTSMYFSAATMDISISCSEVKETPAQVSSVTMTSTTTMDISISSSETEETAAQVSSVAMASLSISVILALVVIALVAIVIALLVIQRRRKREKR